MYQNLWLLTQWNRTYHQIILSNKWIRGKDKVAQLTQWNRSEEPTTEADSCVVIVDCKEWFSLDDFIRFRGFWLAMLMPTQYQPHDGNILTLTSYDAAVREGKRLFHRRQMSHLLITFCNFSIKTIGDWFLFLRYLCPMVMASPFPHLNLHLWWHRPAHQLSFGCLIIILLVQFWSNLAERQH